MIMIISTEQQVKRPRSYFYIGVRTLSKLISLNLYFHIYNMNELV